MGIFIKYSKRRTRKAAKAKSNKELFYCQGKGALAKGELTDDGFLVYKGSTSSIEETNSITKWVSVMRRRLLDDNILKEENGIYVFQQDYIFSSPSGSAATILGRNTNGWIKWKDKDGKTLDELKRK